MMVYHGKKSEALVMNAERINIPPSLYVVV